MNTKKIFVGLNLIIILGSCTAYAAKPPVIQNKSNAAATKEREEANFSQGDFVEADMRCFLMSGSITTFGTILCSFENLTQKMGEQFALNQWKSYEKRVTAEMPNFPIHSKAVNFFDKSNIYYFYRNGNVIYGELHHAKWMKLIQRANTAK